MYSLILVSTVIYIKLDDQLLNILYSFILFHLVFKFMINFVLMI